MHLQAKAKIERPLKTFLLYVIAPSGVWFGDWFGRWLAASDSDSDSHSRRPVKETIQAPKELGTGKPVSDPFQEKEPHDNVTMLQYVPFGVYMPSLY